MANIDGDPLVDPSSTPISKYKNRRRSMMMDQANTQSNVGNKTSFISNTGSMIGNTIDKLKITKNTTTAQDSFLGHNDAPDNGWINEISFQKNEQKDLEN